MTEDKEEMILDEQLEVKPRVISEIFREESLIAKQKAIRSSFAIQMLAALVANSNNRGVLPNPEMMAKEAVKYADALIIELSK